MTDEDFERWIKKDSFIEMNPHHTHPWRCEMPDCGNTSEEVKIYSNYIEELDFYNFFICERCLEKKKRRLKVEDLLNDDS